MKHPTDEEINLEACNFYSIPPNWEDETGEVTAWVNGAKWVRDQQYDFDPEHQAYLITIKSDRQEIERLKNALRMIAEENYDDDDKKHHLYATIDRMKQTAKELL